MAKKYKQRADGRYYTSLQHGFKEDGRPNRIPVYATSSKKLEEKVAELRFQINNGNYKEPNHITVDDYAKKWIKTYKTTRSTNTKRMYNFVIDSHIIPSIGYIKIVNLKRSDIQIMINELGDKRRTCEQILLTLRQIMKLAIEEDIIVKNICDNIELPPKKKSEKRALTAKEVKAIGKSDFTLKEKTFVGLLYYFGLRREEVIALMKNDFDFKNDKLTSNNLYISRAIVFDENTPEIKGTKTLDGERTLIIPDTFKNTLESYISGLDGLYLFTCSDGGLITKSAYNYLFNGIRDKINSYMGGTKKIRVTDLTAYTFRHNYCTLLYYSGMSIKKAADLMGHKDIQMIMNVYAHLDEKKEKADKKINKMFEKKNAI